MRMELLNAMRYLSLALALLGMLCFGAAIFVRGLPAMSMVQANAENGMQFFQIDVTGITQGILLLLGSMSIVIGIFVLWRTRASAN